MQSSQGFHDRIPDVIPPASRQLETTYSEDLEMQNFETGNPKSSDNTLIDDEENPTLSSSSVTEDATAATSLQRFNSNTSSNSSFMELDSDSKATKLKKKASRFFVRLWKGPREPSDNPPTFTNSFLQQFEDFPSRISRSFPLKIKLPFILLYYAFWFWFLMQSLAPYLTETSTYIDPDSNKEVEIISISCRGETSIWKGKNSKCGINGKKCTPFEDREVIFRCPALCDSESITYSSIPVGDQNIKYRNYYVGGGKLENGSTDDDDQLSWPYRSDSYPCGAAVHAGVISPMLGGCARIKFVGSQNDFKSTISQHSTDDSVQFDSFFPSSFQFLKTPKDCKNCRDPRSIIAFANIMLGFPVMFMSQNGHLAFWTTCISGFWTILLIFDPPIVVKVQDAESLPTLFSVGFERFLPMCFILAIVWRIACKTTLGEPSSPICKTLLWYPLFWVGMLNNVTFDRLPVDRLTLTDIMTQPGSLIATSFIVILITSCAVAQAWQLWKAGMFRRYLGIYSLFIFSILILANLHGLNLRVHHYVLALLLIPGTNTKGFTAMLFQGVLLGLLVNGISRWGLASIEETDRSLRRSDPSGEIKPPFFTKYIPEAHAVVWNITEEQPKMIDGEFISPDDMLNKYSLLINDIEVYNGGNLTVSIDELAESNEMFGGLLKDALTVKESVKLYLRVARSGGVTKRSDYTKAAVLVYPDGEFMMPESGLT